MCGDHRLSPRCHLPPPHGHVAIDRVQFHGAGAPPGAFRGDRLGAGAAERLEHQVAGSGDGLQHRLDQRHKDLRNGLSAPPKLTPKHLYQMATRPRWCWNMLQTNRRTFRNIHGHAKSVTDLASLNAWTTEQFDPQLSWKDVEWIKERWGGKLIIKGILDVEDAKMAAETGADAIIVSNHGGRQLDGAHSSIAMLPRIVDAVGDRIEVHLDGGIRSGQDVLKAVALGAKGTFIGRPFLYGLGAMGKPGVTKALEIIAKEMDITMALCGKRKIAEIDDSIIAENPFKG